MKEVRGDLTNVLFPHRNRVVTIQENEGNPATVRISDWNLTTNVMFIEVDTPRVVIEPNGPTRDELLEVLREFIQDVEACYLCPKVFGGNGKMDRAAFQDDWLDLSITYDKAKELLKTGE